MRKESILELIEEAREIYSIINSHRNISKPKVKTIFEHLRSSLDYLAKDINDNLKVPSKIKLYFPYGANEEAFYKSIKRNFPSLQSEISEIYEELLNIQSFQSRDDWLPKLCSLTNEVKHNNPLDIRHSSETVNSVIAEVNNMGLISIGGSSSNIKVRDFFVDGKRIDDFIYDKGKIEITRKGDIPINFKITKDKKILIGDELLDLLPFLDKCINNIYLLTNRIYLVLEKN
ncbi:MULTISPECIES: hypothetical protein [unclassified Acinetobacter]|uniref:hypothetical protein n=1 Tax=unclassified Acinetobacter TaxID=196816 RepID=UPI00287BF2E9|nr:MULTISPECIES: hypothetical protein [unclassified Acinetobacter]MDS7956789.1 hypothetical protein [Acinetobacter sp. V104_13]MDS7984322.1 hypothetical protein [Acinetobacter sp. V104_3]